MLKAMKNIIQTFFFTFILGFTLSCAADEKQAQRIVYQQSINALKSGDTSSYLSAKHLLKDYPLLPYVEFAYLQSEFFTLPSKKISRFMQRHDGQYIASRMYFQWLYYLGEQKNWPLFTQFYQSDKSNLALQCYHLESRLHANENDKAILLQVSFLWLKPYSLPRQCDRLLSHWQAKGMLNEELAWQRFELSYGQGNEKIAVYLQRYLADAEKTLAQKLLSPYGHEDFWFAYLQQEKVMLSSASLTRLLRKLANTHHQQVAQIIANKPHYLASDDLLQLQKISAWHLARQSAEKANAWLADIRAETVPELNEYQLRYALQDKDWLLYQRIFNQLDETMQNDDEWLYWYAIAQQNTHIHDDNPLLQSDSILKRLANRRSFYGFLAAEEKQKTIALNHEPVRIVASAEIEARLAAAFEFYQLGELQSANTEWGFVTRNFDEAQWLQAGLAAQTIQWHSKTIVAFAKAKQWQAIDERFPLAYQDLFFKYAKENLIDQSWLLAMARQESGFAARAQSPAGAQGVLQLMPQTAKRLAQSRNSQYSDSKLFDVDFNIALGSLYLKNLLAQYDNNYILATAAYNAGPNQVNRWLEKTPLTHDWVHWVAIIPFPETRQYVQNILTYSRIYQTRLGDTAPSLSLHR